MSVVPKQVENNTPGLLDLRDLSLTELLSVPGGTALEYALLKLTEAVEQRPQEAVSAFNSAI